MSHTQLNNTTVDNAEGEVKGMAEDLLDNFMERWPLPLSDKKRKVYPDEIQEFFELEFEDRFTCTVEDGSIRDVSQLLCRIYNECSVGNYALTKVGIEKAASMPKVGYTVSVGGRGELVEGEECEYNESDEENMEEGGEEAAAEVASEKEKENLPDADGWTTVKSKSKRR
jgi:hypothetical protein